MASSDLVTTPITLTGEPRETALKIANALIKAGYQESLAVPRAVAEAWTLAQSGESHMNTLDMATPGPALHVHYDRGHWHVTSLSDDIEDRRFNGLDDALDNAYNEVLETNSAIFVHNREGLVERIDPEDRDITSALYFYVAPYKEGWCVSRLGAEGGFFKEFGTKKEALKHARGLARENVARLVVQNSAGEPIGDHDYLQA